MWYKNGILIVVCILHRGEEVMWHVSREGGLDSNLAYQLGSAASSAAIEIDCLKRGKDVSMERLLQLTEILHNLTNKPALERFDFERLDFERFYIVKFFGKMLGIDVMPGKTIKTYDDEVFHAVRKKIENFRLILDKKPKADLRRALDFCITLHRHVLPHYGPKRYDLAA